MEFPNFQIPKWHTFLNLPSQFFCSNVTAIVFIKKNKPKAYEEYLKSMVDRGMIEARQVGHNTYEYVFTTRAICENMQTFRKILQSMDLVSNCTCITVFVFNGLISISNPNLVS